MSMLGLCLVMGVGEVAVVEQCAVDDLLGPERGVLAVAHLEAEDSRRPSTEMPVAVTTGWETIRSSTRALQ